MQDKIIIVHWLMWCSGATLRFILKWLVDIYRNCRFPNLHPKSSVHVWQKYYWFAVCKLKQYFKRNYDKHSLSTHLHLVWYFITKVVWWTVCKWTKYTQMSACMETEVQRPEYHTSGKSSTLYDMPVTGVGHWWSYIYKLSRKKSSENESWLVVSVGVTCFETTSASVLQ